MDTFREEIYKMVDLLHLCGERLVETESFILELYKRKTSNSVDDWKQQIAEFLDEGKTYVCKLNIMDKRTNLTVALDQLNPLKIRNLYMELAAHLDLDEEYDVQQSDDPTIYSVTPSELQYIIEE